jgi:hypothetical protein
LFIHNKPCLDFVYTPNNDTTVKVGLCAVVAAAAAILAAAHWGVSKPQRLRFVGTSA